MHNYNNVSLIEMNFCQGKVVPVHNMKAYGKAKIWFYSFLPLAPDGSE